ncbi:Uncharacterised protein [Tyzzerella nexilis]|uniref:Uncharacterized protein n=1 Tax=[Clostridium] nexile TaxID=29361 RepID=A0A6N2VYS2_9FIRM
MKKKILIIIGVLILLIAILIAVFVVKDLRQEKTLRDEIASIQELAGSEQMDAVNEKLGHIVTTGDYAKVEKAVKNYMADNFNNAITIAEALNDEVLTNALTAENYMSDGPDFVKTKLLLSDLQKRLTKAKEEQKRLSTNETVMSYLKDKEDSYYVDLYKEIIGEEESASEDAIEIEQSIDEVLDMVAVEQSVIDFLSENKGQWTVQDGIVAFSDEALNVQYNQLLLELE